MNSGVCRGECNDAIQTCFNCKEQGHITTYCLKLKRVQGSSQHAQTYGKVFALNGVEVSGSDKLVQDTCFINDIPLIVIIDMGTTHSFISHDCVVKINLEVFLMKSNIIIETIVSASITISFVCLNCLVSIYAKDFGVCLIYLPLSELDVILKMK